MIMQAMSPAYANWNYINANPARRQTVAILFEGADDAILAKLYSLGVAGSEPAQLTAGLPAPDGAGEQHKSLPA